ncbi:XRE family transcriptional regulator [Scytonema hofmannii PCC 7110]|uniref:XRE family transcriptional regulator n=1 Tax=Scytonema hofmannii PCC 7110 TaxID=128403 RepID=A0A139WTM1_9CYAN|nr:XRE family transcriptional regulator [Scytonema hofmannii PCC 7110]
MQMYDPPHIGEVLKEEFLEPYGLSISKFAELIGVNRAYMSKIINGKAGVSPAMALRLSKALNTSVGLWLNMQQQYDLWQARQSTDLSKVKVINLEMKSYLTDDITIEMLDVVDKKP